MRWSTGSALSTCRSSTSRRRPRPCTWAVSSCSRRPSRASTTAGSSPSSRSASPSCRATARRCAGCRGASPTRCGSTTRSSTSPPRAPLALPRPGQRRAAARPGRPHHVPPPRPQPAAVGDVPRGENRADASRCSPRPTTRWSTARALSTSARSSSTSSPIRSARQPGAGPRARRPRHRPRRHGRHRDRAQPGRRDGRGGQDGAVDGPRDHRAPRAPRRRPRVRGARDRATAVVEPAQRAHRRGPAVRHVLAAMRLDDLRPSTATTAAR